MERTAVSRRVRTSLGQPYALASQAWPTGPRWRAAAVALMPFVAVMMLVVLWLLGVVVLSTLGALGLDVVDMEGSLHYVRDTVAFVIAGAVTALVWVVLVALGRAAAEGRRGRHLAGS
jgi:ABC-type Fe3+ transport system permease subunit